jgi:hypothetical protein
MAKDRSGPGYASGRDAAYIKPKFIPNEELLGRDDSGGPDFDPYTAQFGDGGYVTGGAKSYLSASGGGAAGEDGGGTEHSRSERETRGRKGERTSVAQKKGRGREDSGE